MIVRLGVSKYDRKNHSMTKNCVFGAFIAILLLSGCQILGPDSGDVSTSTYPKALDLPAADFGAIMTGQHKAGRFNLTIFVTGISECPEDTICIIADHIQVAESPFTDGFSLMIEASKPSQFKLDDEFILSIEVLEEAFPESQQAQFVRLLAYSPTTE